MKANQLILFIDVIAVYFENHKKHINTLCGNPADILSTTAGGTNNCRWASIGSYLESYCTKIVINTDVSVQNFRTLNLLMLVFVSLEKFLSLALGMDKYGDKIY
jgi:hypothetical protein